MEIYDYKGFWNCKSCCGFYIIILTELKENQGTSITNCYELLATKIYNTWLNNVPIEDITWIEQYQDSEVRYSKVNMEWDGTKFRHPTWEFFKEEDFEKLILNP